MSVKNAARIQRKQSVPEEHRTDGKDEAADYIEEAIIDKGRWPVNMTDIAEESGWSRQHITNTLEDYFEPVDNRTTEKTMPDRTEAEILSGGEEEFDSMMEAYRIGFKDGFKMARKTVGEKNDS